METSKLSNIHLVDQPSFLTGVARIIDLFGLFTEYNSSSSEEAADYYALLADWKAVGDDIRQAIREYREIVK